MKRLINVRPFLFSAVGLIAGIYCAFCFLFGKIFVGVVCLALIVALGVFFICKYPCHLKHLLIVALFCAIGATQIFVYHNTHTKNAIIQREVVLVGRVTDLGQLNEESSILYMENCSDENGNKYSGRVKVVGYDNLSVQTGQVLTIKGTLRSTFPLQSSVQTSNVRNNVQYTLSDIQVVGYKYGKMTVGEQVRKYIYTACCDYSGQSAPVVYALLTGDCNAIAQEDTVAFKRTGTLHLLAVSGQHIVFIVGIINVFIKKLKLNPAVEMLIMLPPLVFFCYICNWVPSIMRALIMLVCGYVASIIFGRYDMLSSVGLSVVVILLWHPLYLFDIGFQLSVLSVYGIATVYSVYQRIISRKKIGKFARNLLDSFVLSCCCTLAITFTSAYHFGQTSIVAPFVNVLAVPVVSVAFVLAVAGLLPWIFHYLLTGAGLLLGAVTQLIRAVSQLSFASAKASTLGITTLIIVVLLFVWGGSVNLSKLGKRLFSVFCVALLVVCTVVAVVPNQPKENVKIFFGYKDYALVATNTSDMAIVTNLADSYVSVDVLSYAETLRYNSCTLYLTDFSQCDTDVLQEFCASLSISKVYIMDRSGNDSATEILSDNNIPIVVAEKNAVLPGSIPVTAVYDGALRGVVVRVGELCVSTVYGSKSAVQNYPLLRPDVDIYVLEEAFDTFSQQNKTTLSFYQQDILYNFGSNKYGVFTIYQKDDIIKVSFK